MPALLHWGLPVIMPGSGAVSDTQQSPPVMAVSVADRSGSAPTPHPPRNWGEKPQRTIWRLSSHTQARAGEFVSDIKLPLNLPHIDVKSEHDPCYKTGLHLKPAREFERDPDGRLGFQLNRTYEERASWGRSTGQSMDSNL